MSDFREPVVAWPLFPLQKITKESRVPIKKSGNGATYPRLNRGDVVQATADFDPQGANVRKGDMGVCFERGNCYHDGAGPMVRWFRQDGSRGGACNVYSDFVRVVHSIKP